MGRPRPRRPVPLFSEVRALGAVHRVTLADGHAAWLVVRYDEARAAPGTWYSAPTGFRHGFRNPGPSRARVLNVHTPDGGFTGRVRGG